MNEAESTSINSNAQIIKAAVKFRTADVSGSLHKKESVQSGTVRTLKEQDLDLIVGRSIN
jgi:hypothetical protein